MSRNALPEATMRDRNPWVKRSLARRQDGVTRIAESALRMRLHGMVALSVVALCAIGFDSRAQSAKDLLEGAARPPPKDTPTASDPVTAVFASESFRSLKVAFAESFLSTLDVPPSAEAMGWSAPEPTDVKLDYSAGRITIGFQGPALLAGKQVVQTAYFDEQSLRIVWVCGRALPPAGFKALATGSAARATTLPDTALPPDCRAASGVDDRYSAPGSPP